MRHAPLPVCRLCMHGVVCLSIKRSIHGVFDREDYCRAHWGADVLRRKTVERKGIMCDE